jgi:hypothetical protein
VTVHLISVGRSVLNSLEKPDDQLADRGLATAIRHSGAHELIPAGGGDAGEQARGASDWVAAALGPGDGAAGSAEPPTGPAARRPGWPRPRPESARPSGRAGSAPNWRRSARSCAVRAGCLTMTSPS